VWCPRVRELPGSVFTCALCFERNEPAGSESDVTCADFHGAHPLLVAVERVRFNAVTCSMTPSADCARAFRAAHYDTDVVASLASLGRVTCVTGLLSGGWLGSDSQHASSKEPGAPDHNCHAFE
jgi:hypothetical protein